MHGSPDFGIPLILDLGENLAKSGSQPHEMLFLQLQRRRLAALAEYGRQVGLAFQIVDDLLDVRGRQTALGKRVGKDSPCGKLTFPGVLGVEESQRRARMLIDAACEALRPLAAPTNHLEALAHYVLQRNR